MDKIVDSSTAIKHHSRSPTGYAKQELQKALSKYPEECLKLWKKYSDLNLNGINI